jgi:hypothetical protein
MTQRRGLQIKHGSARDTVWCVFCGLCGIWGQRPVEREAARRCDSVPEHCFVVMAPGSLART